MTYSREILARDSAVVTYLVENLDSLKRRFNVENASSMDSLPALLSAQTGCTFYIARRAAELYKRSHKSVAHAKCLFAVRDKKMSIQVALMGGAVNPLVYFARSNCGKWVKIGSTFYSGDLRSRQITNQLLPGQHVSVVAVISYQQCRLLENKLQNSLHMFRAPDKNEMFKLTDEQIKKLVTKYKGCWLAPAKQPKSILKQKGNSRGKHRRPSNAAAKRRLARRPQH